jgi:hypothetical protein
MKDKLITVGCNEMLDFVRRDHSASPHLSLLSVSSNAPTARWRFICANHQLWILREAHTMQVARAGERVLRPSQRTHRRMALHLTKSSTLDAGARLKAFNINQHTRTSFAAQDL